MPYADRNDMIARFGEREILNLTDNTVTRTNAINDAVLGVALGDAEAEVNGYLAVRYTVPMSPVPEVVRRLVCDLARYYLYKTDPTEAVTKRYDDAVKMLRAIAAGDVRIGDDGPSPGPADTSSVLGVVEWSPGSKVWGRDTEVDE